MIKIIIADDHPIVRKGIREIIEETKDITVESEASNGNELLNKIKTKNVDIILLDISMPGKSGIEILKQIKQEYPKIFILILSMYPEEQYAIRALKAGAAGYVTKDTAPEELINAIYKIYKGGKYISANLAEKLACELEDNFEKPLHERLSDREYEIMCMIAKGRSLTQIAGELFLSIKTVSTYRARILEKMKLKTNSELTRYAIENNLI